MKIYNDDPLVPYKTSRIMPERSKAEIDGLLATWQVKDTHWHWDMPHNEVYVRFVLEEKIDDQLVKAPVTVPCATIWQRENPRARPPRFEAIDWKTSMRCMWWFIKTHLEMSYVLQSEKIRAFLPYVQGNKTQTVGDIVLARLERYRALEDNIVSDKPGEPRITEAQFEEEKP